MSLEHRIEIALRRRGHDPADLAKVLQVSSNELQTALVRMIANGQVYNLSNVEVPVWVWRVGFDASAEELSESIVQILTHHPMTTDQLVRATGVEEKRIHRTLSALRQTYQKRLVKLADGELGQWSLIPEGVEGTDLMPIFHSELER